MVLGVLVVLALGGAAWLFVAGDDDSRTQNSPKSTRGAADDDTAEGVLSLPKGEDPTDARRRGDEGRDRVDPEADSMSDATPDDEDSPAEQLPAVLANLKGETIALGVASAATPGDAARKVKVGDIRVPCGGGADPARARIELDLVDRLTRVLERAGATVVRTDSPAACVDVRARRAHDADLAVIVRHGSTDTARVMSGRATRTATDASAATSRSMQLAGEIAATAFDAARYSSPKTAADRRALNQSGALDVLGGGAMAYVELPVRVAPIGERDQLALAIATAMGVAIAGPTGAVPVT